MSNTFSDDKLSKLLWVPSQDDMIVYELGEIIQDYVIDDKPNEPSVIVELLNNHHNKVLKKKDVRKFLKSLTYAVDRTHLRDKDLNDLCEMNSLHEAPLLDVLRRRWLKDAMYTYSGEFLISINPYYQIPNLNDKPTKYLDLSNKRDKFKVLPPHVFAIANNALREIMNCEDVENRIVQGIKKPSQSIIVTGESGAGKTEASKLVMNFLTSVNKVSSSSASSSIAVIIKTVILESNAIFEAFGNAKTVRNDNSSRFGKYIKLQYTDGNELWSAHTETFLLEKSRLVSVGKDDRNYHIFYQLIRGIQSPSSQSDGHDSLKQKLKLHNVDDFKILTDGGGTVVTSVENDVTEFEAVCKALLGMNCKDKDIVNIWSLLASILHLGNIKTTNAKDSTHSSHSHQVTIDSPTMKLQEIAHLLGISDVDKFTKALTTQQIKLNNENIIKKLSAEDTKNNVYALMKWIYEGIFNWLVYKINTAHKSISVDQHMGKDIVKFIGILDIFGFEIFVINTFEQLCINYTNERLQQQFNEFAFESEQQQYASEGLDWGAITYRDNQPVLDLIGKKPKGLLFVLEEHSLMNREPDDKALLSAFNNLHAITNCSHPNYAKSRFGNDGFVIRHFAGDVSYVINNFIAKNNDSLQGDLSVLLATTTNTFLLDILNLDAQIIAETMKSQG